MHSEVYMQHNQHLYGCWQYKQGASLTSARDQSAVLHTAHLHGDTETAQHDLVMACPVRKLRQSQSLQQGHHEQVRPAGRLALHQKPAQA